MEVAIVGLVGVIIGGLITTAVKVVELRHNWTVERRRSYIAILEDLHRNVVELRSEIRQLTFDARRRAGNPAIPLELTELEYGPATKTLFDKAVSLCSRIQIYEPSSGEIAVSILETVNHFGSKYLQFTKTDGAEENFDSWLLLTAIEDVYSESHKLERRLAERIVAFGYLNEVMLSYREEVDYTSKEFIDEASIRHMKIRNRQ